MLPIFNSKSELTFEPCVIVRISHNNSLKARVPIGQLLYCHKAFTDSCDKPFLTLRFATWQSSKHIIRARGRRYLLELCID